MTKIAVIIMLLTVFSKILGFAREITLSYFYGTTAIADIYLISQTIPAIIFALISSGFATGFIPMYSQILNERGPKSANRYTNNLSNILLILATVVVVVVLVFAKQIVKIFASGFSGEILHLAVSFTRITIFGVYFSALLGIYGGYLRLHNNYIVPSLISLPMNLILIITLFLSARTNVYVLAFGSVLAMAFQLCFLVSPLRKTGFKYMPVLDVNDKYIKAMINMVVPIIIGRSVSNINVLVDRSLASMITIGGIAALNYASKIEGFVKGLFVDSVITVFYPTISKMAAQNDIKQLKASIAEAISIISLIVIPTTFGAILFSVEIVHLLFGRGVFTQEAIIMTGRALLYYSIGLIPKGFREVLSKGFYAYKDTKTPMINAAIGVALNIILNIILSKYMGIGGLALATSISAIVTAVLMFITLRKKIGSFGLLEISRSFIKIVIASAIMGMFAFGGFKFFLLYFTQNLALIGAIIIGALVYGLIIFFMKIPEVDNTLAVLKKKMGNGIARFKNNNEG